MQSMKARRALLDDTIVECAVSRIWHLFIHIPSCYLWDVIRRICIVRFKAGFKTKQKTTPTTITDKGKKTKSLENEQDFTSLFFSKLFRTGIKIKIV